MVSSFTHPYVVLKLYDYLSSVERKRRYFEICLIYIFLSNGNQWSPKLFSYQHSLKYQKKERNTGLEQHEGE